MCKSIHGVLLEVCKKICFLLMREFGKLYIICSLNIYENYFNNIFIYTLLREW